MRDDFSIAVKRIVANRVNSRCSNPSCRTITSGPQLDPSKALSIGVAAHITAAASGGPRFDPSLASADRKHATNAIWLCQNCAKLVDNDEKAFPSTLLIDWKNDAEKEILLALGKTAGSVDSKSANLSTEELELLSAAKHKGEILVIEVDELSPWVMINGENFSDTEDPAVSAIYLDALESLISRGLVDHKGGILNGLTGRGFKLARSLENFAPDVAEDESDNGEVGQFEIVERIRLVSDKFMPYRFTFSDTEGITYEIDANHPVHVFLLDRKDYGFWRNEGQFDGYYKIHESKLFVAGDLFPQKAGDYYLVIQNASLKGNTINVKIEVSNQ